MAHALHNIVYARLEAIANAEKITRKELAELSRELLLYVPADHDIDIVNRLIGILTPVNRRAAIAYFKHFLPWQVEYEADEVTFIRFGKMVSGDKKIKNKQKAIIEWLSDETNNIWRWSDNNLDIEVKQKNFAGLIQRQIQKALEGDDKTNTPALSHAEVMKAVLAGGVTLEDLLDALTDPQEGEMKTIEGEAKDVTPPAIAA